MAANTEIDWAAGLFFKYPDNNHDDAPRCPPIELDELNSCPNPPSDSGTEAGNPIDCATGRKVQTETDYVGHGMDAMSFSRNYRSPLPGDADGETGGGGFSNVPAWLPRAVPRISSQSFADGSELHFLIIGDWYRRAFYRKSSDQAWQVNPFFPRFSVHSTGGGAGGSGYAVTTSYGKTYGFEGGDEVSESREKGPIRYYYQYTSFPTGPRVTRISNRFGAFLEFEYQGPDNQLTRLRDQNGQEIHYRYDSRGNLSEVIYPDDTPADLSDNPRRNYLFENVDFPHHLTGIISENGERYATFAYDEQGRGVRTEHAQGAERVEVDYPEDGEARVRFYQDSEKAVFREEYYTYGQFRGAHRLTSKTVTACPSCASTTETWDYQEGLLRRHVSPGGSVTEWSYDSQGRKLSETTAAGTPEATTITYTWNNLHNKLHSVETESRITTYLYDDQGRLVETTVTAKQ